MSGSPSRSTRMPRSTGFCWRPEPRIWMRGWSLPPKNSWTTTPGASRNACASVGLPLWGISSAVNSVAPPAVAKKRSRTKAGTPAEVPSTTIVSRTIAEPGEADWARQACAETIVRSVASSRRPWRQSAREARSGASGEGRAEGVRWNFMRENLNENFRYHFYTGKLCRL
ncbi:hypothetical protein BOSE29B_80221 [Bosea sp. 29B]|nr:hypothetical protein BOSE29B_80221 [Bosea sp. 29B]